MSSAPTRAERVGGTGNVPLDSLSRTDQLSHAVTQPYFVMIPFNHATCASRALPTENHRIGSPLRHSKIDSNSLFACGHCTNLRAPLVHSPLWGIYNGSPSPANEYWFGGPEPSDPRCPWLDDPRAWQALRDTFSGYADELSAADDGDPADLKQVRAILEGFERLHRTGEDNLDRASSTSANI
ncbi:hypothetical protein C8R46DRAFT_474742 [Mycena filopes]|nr:hypothetical protein C8R46DRAFT_474742 [Mycena filopes]